jgi:hypothetical protein
LIPVLAKNSDHKAPSPRKLDHSPSSSPVVSRRQYYSHCCFVVRRHPFHVPSRSAYCRSGAASRSPATILCWMDSTLQISWPVPHHIVVASPPGPVSAWHESLQPSAGEALNPCQSRRRP